MDKKQKVISRIRHESAWNSKRGGIRQISFSHSRFMQPIGDAETTVDESNAHTPTAGLDGYRPGGKPLP